MGRNFQFFLEPETDSKSHGTVRDDTLREAAASRHGRFLVTLLEKHIVHGYAEADYPASLLVYRLTIRTDPDAEKIYPRSHRRIRALQVSLRLALADDTDADPSRDPYVLGWEPAANRSMHVGDVVEVSHKHTTGREGTADVKAKLSPAEIGVGGKRSREHEAQYTLASRVRLESSATRTEPGARDRLMANRVTWTMHENEAEEVPDTLEVGLVVARPAEGRFCVYVDVNTAIDWKESVKRRLFRTKEGCVTYDPNDGSEQEAPDGVDIDQLGALAHGKELMRFCGYSGPEEIVSSPFYSRD